MHRAPQRGLCSAHPGSSPHPAVPSAVPHTTCVTALPQSLATLAPAAAARSSSCRRPLAEREEPTSSQLLLPLPLGQPRGVQALAGGAATGEGSAAAATAAAGAAGVPSLRRLPLLPPVAAPAAAPPLLILRCRPPAVARRFCCGAWSSCCCNSLPCRWPFAPGAAAGLGSACGWPSASAPAAGGGAVAGVAAAAPARSAEGSTRFFFSHIPHFCAAPCREEDKSRERNRQALPAPRTYA